MQNKCKYLVKTCTIRACIARIASPFECDNANAACCINAPSRPTKINKLESPIPQKTSIRKQWQTIAITLSTILAIYFLPKDSGTAVIGAIAAHIAYQQWLTNRNKLRLDLYNKRFDVYSNTLNFCQSLSKLEEGQPSTEFQEQHFAFIRSYREARFLFSKESEIHSNLKKIGEGAFAIICFYKNAEEARKSGLRDILLQMNEKRSVAQFEIENLIEKIEEAMSEYMNFHEESS